jgi:2-dehydro-3-deoxyphosphogluconate aldolase/(4S)-4-hydroxy-2-oxoglutarate aldolase
MDASELLSGVRVVPVVVIDDADNAVPLAECLVESGLSTIEVTLRTDAALDSISPGAPFDKGLSVAGICRQP